MTVLLVIAEDVTKCLEAVPKMFFRPAFNLSDPNTFEEVTNLPNTTSLQDEVGLAVFF